MVVFRYISLLAHLLIFSYVAHAQQTELKFHRLNTKDGLSHDHVTAICKDSQGYMWFGTERGLSKYDGYEFTVFKNDPKNLYSIGGNFINDIAELKNHQLLIGLNTGLSVYDREKNVFKQHKISDFSVRTIFESKKGQLWLGTDGGLFLCDLKQKKLERYQNITNDSTSLSDNFVNKISEDSNGNLWIGTLNGLNYFDVKSRKFRHYFHHPGNENSINSNFVRAVFIDSKEHIWIGTKNSGVCVLDQHGQILKKFNHNVQTKNGLSHNDILSFNEDAAGNIWIGTENGGIDLYSYKTDSFTNHTTRPGDEFSISNPSIYCIYNDNNNDIWIGTYAGGINYLPLYREKFTHHGMRPNTENTLSNSNVFCLDGDSEGILWLGTDGGGLNSYNPQTGAYHHYRHNAKDEKSIASDYIFSVHTYDRYHLIITYHRGGFDIFDKRTGFCKRFYDRIGGIKGDVAGLCTSSILTSFKQDNVIWLGTAGFPVTRFDTKKNTLRFYDFDRKDKNAVGGDAIFTIFNDSFNNLWFGTSAGLSLYDSIDDNFTQFKSIKVDSTSLGNGAVYSILQDSKKNLWIGTENGGLNLFDYKTKTFSHYTEQEGLANNTVFGILEDKAGNLWLSTNKGISRFDVSTKAFRNYDFSDGIQGVQFRYNASYCSADGTLYFGGSNGFCSFNPESFKDDPIIPPIRITEFQVFNKTVTWNEPESSLKVAIDQSSEITLPYDKSVFSFKFSALNYNFSQQNEYAYRLMNFDKEWNYIGTKRTVTYTNLDPGEYVFKVRGSNQDGAWNETGTQIRITITPPFWKTWWFRTTTVLFAVCLLFFIFKIRVRNVENQKKILEQQVAERTHEILYQKEEIETQKESIEEKNAMLETHYMEIMAKNEQILIQNASIEEARLEIKKKNEELLYYNVELEDMVKAKTGQLEKTFNNLKESNQELDQFIYRSAHDLKGPIATILGLCHLGMAQTTDQNILDLFELMKNSSDQMTQKLARLMKIHEINTMKVTHKPIYCNDLIKEILCDLSWQFDTSKLEINLISKQAIAYTDKGLLRTLLSNLIENAIKYRDDTKEQSYLTITSDNTDNKTVFSVADNGIGIPLNDASRIFDLFVVAADVHGFGMGLYESKIIARKLMGEIRLVETQTGITEFKVIIPIQ